MSGRWVSGAVDNLFDISKPQSCVVHSLVDSLSSRRSDRPCTEQFGLPYYITRFRPVQLDFRRACGPLRRASPGNRADDLFVLADLAHELS